MVIPGAAAGSPAEPVGAAHEFDLAGVEILDEALDRARRARLAEVLGGALESDVAPVGGDPDRGVFGDARRRRRVRPRHEVETAKVVAGVSGAAAAAKAGRGEPEEGDEADRDNGGGARQGKAGRSTSRTPFHEGSSWMDRREVS